MKFFIYIFFSLIFFIPVNSIESYISFKVNNEIITNIDLDTEYQYLIALNSELKKVDKQTLLKLAKESIIKEKIKKNEIQKFYNFGQSENLLGNIIENYYKKLGMEDLDSFINYLSENSLNLQEVKDKIEIEMLWNKLVGKLYKDQLNINVELLKEKIEKNFNNNKFVTEYELSEIIFQITTENNLSNKVNLIKKDIAEQGFKNAANIHSVVDSSKFGGKIGWFDEKQLSPKIITAIKELEIGELSKPLDVPNGFMILKVEDKKQKQIKMNKKKLLEQAITFEKNKQYQQYSIIYYNKVKLNSIISE